MTYIPRSPQRKTKKQRFNSADFTYSAVTQLSTVEITEFTVNESVPCVKELARNGVTDFVLSVDAPSSPGQWRVNGSTVEIFGNVTQDGDTYWVAIGSNEGV